MASIARLVIVGTPDNDDILAIPTRPWTGMDDDNVIQGLGGDDRLDAGGGDDRIDGGPGDDRIQGGTGSDTAVHSQLRQAYEVFRYDLSAGGREAVVRGPDGVDALFSVEFLEFPTSSGARDRVPLTSFAEFSALSYAASYPDLASAFGDNQTLAWSHFRDFGAKEDRAATFDGLQYVAGHDDLAAAFGSSGGAQAIAAAGARHYILNGRAEGRVPDEFDEAQYLANYPDLAAAGLVAADQLALHYIAHGRAEGRGDVVLPDGLNYLASYADLSAAFGADASQGTLHYLRAGLAEGREVTFNGLQYVAGYDDLAAAFGSSGGVQAIDDAGARHFILDGRAEGRLPDEFNEEQYRANYPDLAAAGLVTADQLALHYIAHGRAEGRIDLAPLDGII